MELSCRARSTRWSLDEDRLALPMLPEMRAAAQPVWAAPAGLYLDSIWSSQATRQFHLISTIQYRKNAASISMPYCVFPLAYETMSFGMTAKAHVILDL